MITADYPTLQVFHIEGVKHIVPEEALHLLEKYEAVLIDVRETSEVSLESIPLDNVLYHPMSEIMNRLQFIATEQNIIVGCQGGVRSSRVAEFMCLHGYKHVANLDGGFKTWQALGFPFKINTNFNVANGCGCSNPNTIENISRCC